MSIKLTDDAQTIPNLTRDGGSGFRFTTSGSGMMVSYTGIDLYSETSIFINSTPVGPRLTWGLGCTCHINIFRL